jgi:hypothetical protein
VARPGRYDVDPAGGTLVLENREPRRRERRRKRGSVPPSLVAALLASCADARVLPTGSVFATGRNGEARAMSRQRCWKLVTGLAARPNGVPSLTLR